MASFHRTVEPVEVPTGVAFELVDEEGRAQRFVVSAIALDALEREADAPSNWLRAFGLHEARILEAARRALAAGARGGSILLTAAQVCAVPPVPEAEQPNEAVEAPMMADLLAMPPESERPLWLQ